MVLSLSTIPIKAYGGMEVIYECYTLVRMDVGGELHAPAALLPEKKPRYSLDKGLDLLAKGKIPARDRISLV
jgi:hypothetical protein